MKNSYKLNIGDDVSESKEFGDVPYKGKIVTRFSRNNVNYYVIGTDSFGYQVYTEDSIEKSVKIYSFADISNRTRETYGKWFFYIPINTETVIIAAKCNGSFPTVLFISNYTHEMTPIDNGWEKYSFTEYNGKINLNDYKLI